MSAPSLPAQRAGLAATYARLRKHHRPRADIARQLQGLTTRVLKREVAEAQRAAERERKAATAARQSSLLDDLDRLIN